MYVRETSGDFSVLLFARLQLEVCMYPKSSATGHLNAGFRGFPLLSSKCRSGSQDACSYCQLFAQTHEISFEMRKFAVNQEMKISQPFSNSTISYNP
jgi:hypothetical protein